MPEMPQNVILLAFSPINPALSSGTQRSLAELSAQCLLFVYIAYTIHVEHDQVSSLHHISIMNGEQPSHKSRKRQTECVWVIAFHKCTTMGIASAIPVESGFLSWNRLTLANAP